MKEWHVYVHDAPAVMMFQHDTITSGPMSDVYRNEILQVKSLAHLGSVCPCAVMDTPESTGAEEMKSSVLTVHSPSKVRQRRFRMEMAPSS